MSGSAASQKNRDGPDHRTVALMTLYDEYLETLEYGISDHVAVAQATGVIMQRHDLSVDEAGEYLCGNAASFGTRAGPIRSYGPRLAFDSTTARIAPGSAGGETPFERGPRLCCSHPIASKAIRRDG